VPKLADPELGMDAGAGRACADGANTWGEGGSEAHSGGAELEKKGSSGSLPERGRRDGRRRRSGQLRRGCRSDAAYPSRSSCGTVVRAGVEEPARLEDTCIGCQSRADGGVGREPKGDHISRGADEVWRLGRRGGGAGGAWRAAD
jgi:hypothetical protein